MKTYTLTAAALFAICLPTQAANEDTQKIIKTFGIIGGGYELNKRCKLLDEKKTAEFDKYYKKSSEQIRDFLLTEPKADHDYARAVAQASMKTIEEEKYSSCGKEAENLIKVAFEAANQWAHAKKLR